MTPEILDIIKSCEWFPSHFFFISENVFSPLLYYSYFGAGIPVIIVGLLIYLSNTKRLENKLLFTTVLFFVTWMLGNLLLWATEFPKYTMFFWTFINIIEPFIYFFAFYFSYVFFFKKDFSIIQKFIFSLPLVPTLILAPTKFSLLGYDLTNCDRNAYEGVLASYGYIIEILAAFFIVVMAIYALRKSVEKVARREIFLVSFGIVLFLLSFSLGNIVEVFTENWYIGQYGLFGAPIFMAFLAFIIVRFKAFDIKLVGSQALVWGLVILISSQFFFIQNNINRILTAVTLILSTILGLMIVRSVKKEILQREELTLANENQQLLIRFITHQVKGFFTRSKMVFASILEGDFGQAPDTMMQIVKDGLDSDSKAVDMVQEVLNASSLRNGQMPYSFQGEDLVSIIKPIVESFRQLAEDKGLEYVFDLSLPTISTKVDKIQISQAFKNLIDNSIKYTQSGSVKMTLGVKNNMALFTISDTGVGLSDKDKSVLFKEGGRGDESLKFNVNSTGYGLFIVKKIVEGHDGHIWAESAGRGHGSHFYVEIPIIVK